MLYFIYVLVFWGFIWMCKREAGGWPWDSEQKRYK